MTKNEWKIEKGIKIPRINERFNYPWRDMEVGDSVYVEGTKARSACFNFATRNKEFRFATRKEGNGIRIWRIKKEGL